MRDVLPTLRQWASAGHRFALATVTRTWGSSPRPLGSVMGVRDDGLICGSVSGGCVEGAVIDGSLAALADGLPREMVFDALSEGSVWDVGLSCGGKIQVWVEPSPVIEPVADLVECDRSCVLALSLSGARVLWVPGSPASTPLAQEMASAYEERLSREAEVEGERFFLHVLLSRERLLIVGAVHIAVPLIGFARSLGFETVVIDPRGQFASDERFPDAPDRMVVEWPQKALADVGITEETYIVVLTHDPKIDDVAIAEALRSPAAYIGALGSRTTQASRRAALLALGFSEADLERIHGPVGLAIGARSPEEIALSIMAEIVQVRNGRR